MNTITSFHFFPFGWCGALTNMRTQFEKRICMDPMNRIQSNYNNGKKRTKFFVFFVRFFVISFPSFFLVHLWSLFIRFSIVSFHRIFRLFECLSFLIFLLNSIEHFFDHLQIAHVYSSFWDREERVFCVCFLYFRTTERMNAQNTKCVRSTEWERETARENLL